MRFLLPAIALVFLGFLGFSDADLRYASTPKNAFATRNRANSVAFTTKLALYLEPSTFNYQGLANQRANNYDNFLRSNIDNEQDNRNFNTEAGKDHLPFRTLEAKATDATNQLPAPLAVEPGKEYVLPLRWNNPHASEMELNIWIAGNTVVVPIKKPVCSGEGYQDGVISFTVPADFNALGEKVQGFQGCTKLGDCVLQMYAHSVEPRTYAAGTPIIISGWDPSKATATSNAAVQPATTDPGTDLSKQPRDTCLPSSDPTSNIANAVPRFARQVSDVFNHAYQNSDYSPYSGQQHEAISKNMQAAGILRMVNGNRGELGKSILTQEQKNVLATLRNTANTIVQNYEKITNKIINSVLKNGAKSTGTVAGQALNNCFRCLETNSVSANRIQTTTYVPSFQITNAAQLAQAKQIVAQADAKYANLINANGVVQIYVQALADMAPAYQQLQAKHKLTYQPPVTKPSPATLADATQFRKVDAAGNKDGGKYAATKAKQLLAARAAAKQAGLSTNDADQFLNTVDINSAPEQYSFSGFTESGASILSGIDISTFAASEISGPIAALSIEGSQLGPNVDDDETKQNNYFDAEDAVEAQAIGQVGDADKINQQQAQAQAGCSGSSVSVPMVAGVSAAGGALVVGIIAAGLFAHQKKQNAAQNNNQRVFTETRV